MSLGGLRVHLGLDLWSAAWPLPARVLPAFFASELVWCWIHRSEHRFAFLWRVSGHGVHHSFARLNAINFNTDHPFEALLSVLPMTLVTLLFGAGEEAVLPPPCSSSSTARSCTPTSTSTRRESAGSSPRTATTSVTTRESSRRATRTTAAPRSCGTACSGPSRRGRPFSPLAAATSSRQDALPDGGS